MKKYVGLFIAWGLFFLSAVAFAAANYEENVVEAEGYGLSAAGSATEVQARLTARRAAIADAQRVLAEEMAAVQVDAETRVEDAALKSDVVQTKVTRVPGGTGKLRGRRLSGDGGGAALWRALFGCGGAAEEERASALPVGGKPIPGQGGEGIRPPRTGRGRPLHRPHP